MSLFDEFIFPKRLENELRLLVEHPDLSEKVICFSGKPGIGKTSFAKAFAKAMSYSQYYHALNEGGISPSELDNLGLGRVSLDRFIDEESMAFDRVILLDEFHNLAPRQQDYFKIRFDDIRDTERVIVILNTTNKKQLEDVVSSAIYSRMYEINFDITEEEAREMAPRLASTFEHLTPSEIAESLPDMRRLEQLNRQAKLREVAL